MLLGSWDKERQIERESSIGMPRHPNAGQVLEHCPLGRVLWVAETPFSITESPVAQKQLQST